MAAEQYNTEDLTLLIGSVADYRANEEAMYTGAQYAIGQVVPQSEWQQARERLRAWYVGDLSEPDPDEASEAINKREDFLVVIGVLFCMGNSTLTEDLQAEVLRRAGHAYCSLEQVRRGSDTPIKNSDLRAGRFAFANELIVASGLGLHYEQALNLGGTMKEHAIRSARVFNQGIQRLVNAGLLTRFQAASVRFEGLDY